MALLTRQLLISPAEFMSRKNTAASLASYSAVKPEKKSRSRPVTQNSNMSSSSERTRAESSPVEVSAPKPRAVTNENLEIIKKNEFKIEIDRPAPVIEADEPKDTFEVDDLMITHL